MAQTVQLQLSKQSGQPWGFRLQGGKDFNMPLVIQKVNGNGAAEQAGMRAGDAVISVAGMDVISLRHKEVQDLVISAGNSLEMTVQRGGFGSPRAPSLQPSLPKPAPVKQPINRNPFSSYKSVDNADSSVKSMVHSQFNSPLSLYSEEKIAETLSAQAEVLSGGAMGVNFKRYEPVPWKPGHSDVLRMLNSDTNGSQQTPPLNSCVNSAATSAEPKQHTFNTSVPGTPPKSNSQSSKVGPPVAPKPTAGQSRTPPGMRSTAATVIRADPSTGDVTLKSAVDSETHHFNAFNRSPQSFKDQPDTASIPNTPRQSLDTVGVPDHAGIFHRAGQAITTPEPSEELTTSNFANDKLPCGQPLRVVSPAQPNKFAAELNPFKEIQRVDSPAHHSAFASEEQHREEYSQQQLSEQFRQQVSTSDNKQHSGAIAGGGGYNQSEFSQFHQRSSAATSCKSSSSVEKSQDGSTSVTRTRRVVEQSEHQQHETLIRKQTVVQGLPPTGAFVTERSVQPSAEPSSAHFIASSKLAPAGVDSSQQDMHQFAGQTQQSQVDYTSYVSQQKSGTNKTWSPLQTEERPGSHLDGASMPLAAAAQLGARSSALSPSVPVAPSSCSSVDAAKQMAPQSVKPGFVATPPSAAPPIGKTPNVSFPGAAQVPAVGGGGAGGGGGKSATAGKTNSPRRGRGQRKVAGSGLRIPVCSACSQQIRGPFIAALGQCWCPGCFVCSTAQCHQNLENIGFVEVNEKIHCENCWETYLAPTCSKCQKRIKGDCLKAVGTCYHPECFACAYCGGLFGNSAFFMEDGLPYCENDWNELFTTKCVGCGFPIEAGDRWVEALNKNFHAQCFKCAVCRAMLDGKQFFVRKGRAVCKSHATMF